NDLLPPPVKKKYSRDHVMMLIFIYYYKGILSINDIQTLLKPISDKFFGTSKEFNLETIYEMVFGLEDEQTEVLKKDIDEKFRISKETFSDAPEDSKEFLQIFSFICMLSFDVYMKRLLIEKMIDGLNVKSKDKKQQKPQKE
ncbi:MAG: DUF1836 domain-containing protein, partial [Lachnospiraceae bacterium]|nr:DUF1836 domain-containing protein [Lachnospiraceae bacterium]